MLNISKFILPALLMGCLSGAAYAQQTREDDMMTRTAPKDPFEGRFTSLTGGPSEGSVFLSLSAGQPVKPPGNRNPKTAPDSLQKLAGEYGLRTYRSGQVTALVPTTMISIGTNLGKPDIEAGLQHEQRLYLFLASLTQHQWRLIGSINGIGMGDLDEQQRNLFAFVLPDPFVIRRIADTPNPQVATPKQDEAVLSAEQMARVRMRLKLTAHLLGTKNNKTTLLSVADFQEASDESNLPFRLSAGDAPQSLTLSFGSPIRREVANRLNGCDIDFASASLAKEVHLEGARTVGEVIEKVVSATGVPIYTDARIRSLPLLIQGNVAVASDLLKSLCLCVCGAVRKVDAVYILTSNKVGIATRVGKIHEWQQDALLAVTSPDQAIETIRQSNIDLATFSSDDPFTNDPQVRNLFKRREKDAAPDGGMNVDSAPEPIRKLLAKLSLRADTVKCAPGLVLSYLVSRGIEVDDEGVLLGPLVSCLWGEPEARKNQWDVERLFPRKMLVVSDALLGDEDSKKFLHACSLSGVEGVMVKPTNFDKQGLSKFVQVAKEHRIKVYAVHSLMKAPPTPTESSLTPADYETDINLFGETRAQFAKRRLAMQAVQRTRSLRRSTADNAEWLRCDSNRNRRATIDSLAELISTPDLSGVVLTDTLPPGYGDYYDNRYYSRDAGGDYGYSPEMRLEFIKQENVDPLDIVTFRGIRANLSIPFFPTGHRESLTAPGRNAFLYDNTIETRWNKFRYQKNTEAVKEFVEFLFSRRPDLEVWTYSGRDAVRGWYSQCKKGAPIPSRVRTCGIPSKAIVQLNASTAGATFLSIQIPRGTHYWDEPNLNLTSSTLHVDEIVSRESTNGWGGIILDVSLLPPSDVFTTLGRL